MNKILGIAIALLLVAGPAFAGEVEVTAGTNPLITFDGATQDGSIQYNNADGGSWTFTPALPTEVAGSTTQVQYNDAGAFGAEAAFAYDADTNTLSVPIIDLTTALSQADGGTGLDGTAATDGQLLIGDTGVGLALATLTGTTNQITVTNGASSITLSLPQSIATTSDVQFDDVALTGNVAVGAAKAVGFGTADTDTSWRIIRDGDNLVFQQYEVAVDPGATDAWVTKFTING